MAPLLVITGPPGAGKSTVARVLAGRASRPSVLIEGDRFFQFLVGGAVEPWLPESHAQNEVVTRAAAAAAGTYAAGGFVTVYEGVVGPWFLPTFVRAAGAREIDYVILLPPVDVCVERVAVRVGHGFSHEPATRKMHGEFVGAEIDPRHVVTALPDQAEVVADVVEALWRDGSLNYVDGG